MGGMIVQHMAIEHPQRVLSMTSIMSTTGDRSVGAASPESLALLLTPPPSERGPYIERSVEIGRVIGGPLFDEERARDRAGKSFDRCFHPVGAAFQLAAILSDADRTPALGSVRCPTLVIHGRADSLVNVSGGEATAKAIPGAELVLLDEMGHDLPEKLWPDIADAIAKNAARA
jgi:pimeloyl-ACP methyl ester carboxylesterase